MKRGQLHDMFWDIREQGSARVEKKRLLWWLGRTNDGVGAWNLLLDEWEEFGGDREELHGLDHNGHITLTMGAADKVAEDWAGLATEDA
jgi:hypothetical protein